MPQRTAVAARRKKVQAASRCGIPLFGRHAIAAACTLGSGAVFWFSRPTWSAEMRLWKAVGDASWVMLLVTLLIGPLSRLWRPASRLLAWRRETGIWFALAALAHGVLVANGWARWSVLRFLGYEFVPQLGRTARMEPGFGAANLMGLVALFWALVLAATSSDRATRFLGSGAWKWLHSASYVVFYLGLVHAGYFLFMHYTRSFHKNVPPPDWFRIPFLLTGVLVIGAQMAAFAKTSARSRAGSASRGR